MPPNPTYGLTHFAIKVKDVKRTVKFYKDVFNVRLMYDNPGWAQVQTPGSHDILVFEESKGKDVGKTGGIVHFGFRLRNPKDIGVMLKRLKKVRAKIKDQGEFVPGSPYVFFYDPDGYEIEIWYEKL